MTPAGFPHSGTHGSQPAFGFPWLIVDCYALHRLPVPRHPPCALFSLTNQLPFSNCPGRTNFNHARITLGSNSQNYSFVIDGRKSINDDYPNFYITFSFLYSVLKVHCVSQSEPPTIAYAIVLTGNRLLNSNRLLGAQDGQVHLSFNAHSSL